MIFIKDLDWAANLSAQFREDLEAFLPRWIESLVPYYKVGKECGADLFEICNTSIPTPGGNDEPYEKDGIDYYITKSNITKISFNGDKGYRKCNWLECFCLEHPDFNTTSHENINNFIQYNLPMTRCFNHRPEYRELADRCNSYFKGLTGDADAGLSLSTTSMIYYNGRGEGYMNYWHGIR